MSHLAKLSLKGSWSLRETKRHMGKKKTGAFFVVAYNVQKVAISSKEKINNSFSMYKINDNLRICVSSGQL